MDRELKGKVVVVTGAADGLGLAMVTSFLEEEVKLAIILDIKEEKGRETVKILKQKYGDDRVVFYKCDVTKDLDEVYQKIISNHNKIDILINNAGVHDEKNMKKTININTIALIEWTMKFYEYMRLDKGGRGGTIINVSSIFAFRITAFLPSYHASKSAVLTFSKSMGHELNFKKSGVRVVTLCPGLTHTNMANNPISWEDESVADLIEEVKDYEWQDPPAIGNGIVEIFKKGDSGSVWLVEGFRPAEKLNI